MSESYGWLDVITSPYDKRLKVGEKYYMYDNPSLLIRHVNNPDKNLPERTLTKINCCSDYPFVGEYEGEKYNYIHCMKVKEKTYKPYDLSLEATRKALLGMVVRRTTGDRVGMVTGFYKSSGDWYAVVGGNGYCAETLCNEFVFDSSGAKVGLYEEDNN